MSEVMKEISRKEAFLKALSWSSEPTVSALSAQGKLALEGLDFPTTREENWKYTRTAKISKLELEEGKAGNASPANIPDLEAHRLCFVDGIYNGELSTVGETQEGIILCALSEAITEHPELVEKYIAQNLETAKDIFTALNAAFNQDGLVLFVPKNAQLEKPVEVINVCSADNCLQQPRNLIIVEESAKAEVILRYEHAGAKNALVNTVTEAYVKANASLGIDKLQLNVSDVYQVSNEEVSQERDSKFAIRTFMHKSDWIRNDLSIRLNGENAENYLSGAYLLAGKEHADNHTTVDHLVPHCTSNELYKGLVDDKSTAVFNGKVFVREDAQKTEAYQSNANILLSDDASINSKPELEIYADDVKCSHGSTTGQFDEEAVFYLKARGLDEDSAYRMLTTAFIGEVVEQVENTALRNHVVREMQLGDIFLDIE